MLPLITDRTDHLHPSATEALCTKRRNIGALHARYRAANQREWPSWAYRWGNQVDAGDGPLSRLLSVCPDGTVLLTIAPVEGQRGKVNAWDAERVKDEGLAVIGAVLRDVPQEYLHYQWAIRPSPYVGWHMHLQIDKRVVPHLLAVEGWENDIQEVDDPKGAAGYIKHPGARKRRILSPAYVDELDKVTEHGLRWREELARLGKSQPKLAGWVGIPGKQEWHRAAQEQELARKRQERQEHMQRIRDLSASLLANIRRSREQSRTSSPEASEAEADWQPQQSVLDLGGGADRS